jgi:hemolysin
VIKPIILSLAAATTLAACNALEKESVPMTGMPNPASEFCVKQGGKLEIKKDKDGGEYGMCHLPDGTVVEEWAYFRQHNK